MQFLARWNPRGWGRYVSIVVALWATAAAHAAGADFPAVPGGSGQDFAAAMPGGIPVLRGTCFGAASLPEARAVERVELYHAAIPFPAHLSPGIFRGRS